MSNFNTVKAINNGSACSVLFLSTTGLSPTRRKILDLLTSCEVHVGKYSNRSFEVRSEQSEVHTKNLGASISLYGPK